MLLHIDFRTILPIPNSDEQYKFSDERGLIEIHF